MKRIAYLTLISISFIFALLFSSRIFYQLSQNNIDLQLSNDTAVTYRLKEHIVERFYKTEQDAVFVSSYLGEYLDNNDIAAINNVKNSKTGLQGVVSGLIRSNSVFTSMSYIDTNGDEAITVDVNGLVGTPLLDEAVKNACFQKTSVHKSGEVYVSFDDQSLYVCSPVYDEAAALLGVSVMTANKEELLKELRPLISERNIILMEDTGRYILTSSRYTGESNFLDEYPQSVFSEILSAQSGNLVHDKSTLLTYTDVELDDRQWFLVLSTDRESVTAQTSALYRELMGVLILAVLAIIIAIIFWINSSKKAQIAEKEKNQKEQLESINNELREKQYTLEEQNALVEELNSQLEEENYKYHQQREILHAIFDSLGAGIMMTDTDGAILFVNEAWKDIFRHIKFENQFYSQGVFYIDGVTLNSTERIIENMMTGIEGSNEIFDRLKGLLTDKKTRYNVDMEQTIPMKRFLNLYSNPCVSHNDDSYGRVFVVRDVSHQKEVDRLKLELISTVSHELRTPMSSIMGFSELILTRELSPERNKEYIGIINSEAKRLTTLINDFLDIQKMESGKHVFNKQLNSIDQIIEEAVSLFQNSSDKHKVSYCKAVKNIPPVYCDRDKVLQVLTNLLSNAIKYSPDGGEVKISLELDNNRVKIGVSDQGLGIPDEVKGKLFTKFYRIQNDDRREIGGTGLGLAICKEIVRAHRGEIEVESTIGHGSTFSFYLPYSEGSTGSNPAKKAESNLYTNCKGDVLIVEDDESIVKLIKEVLKDEGLELHAVCSGEEALQLIASNVYKLIILDIALNGQLNGWDVLQVLKSCQETVNIPIIISSVYENKAAASRANIADYLVKPFESEQLIRMVNKALNGKLDSKMAVNNNDGLTDVILDMLNTRGISVKKIDYSGNMLIITLEGEEGLENEQ